MALKPGTRLGSYDITAKIGAGGMGEVYRATDSKLKRDVAIKVLPEEMARDTQRLERFEREAHVLASLNHPNIASIYGLEESGGVPCLVLELVEGPDLARVLVDGAISVEKALEITRQIALALEAAHGKGVVHRDLKPANVNVTPDGMVKVLDFGLAKALADDPKEGSADSPTLTLTATRAGVIIGTVAYMSPEQARGEPVDKRTDIWAFGCVLYELLTRQQAFSGETASDAIARILECEPDLDALPPATPLRVRELLQRCLRKKRNERLHDIADARIEIDEALANPDAPTIEMAQATAVSRGGRGLALGLLTVGLVLGGALGFLLFRGSADPANNASTGPIRSHVVLPENLPVVKGGDFAHGSPMDSPLALSPDGSELVYVAAVDGTTLLVRRPLGSYDATLIPGTEGANSPTFSPDGRWVAFVTDSEIKKVSLDGGEPVVLCEAQVPWSVAWSADGHVYFTHHESQLVRVAETGGAIEELLGGDVFSLRAVPGRGGALVNSGAEFSSSKDNGAIWYMDGKGKTTLVFEGGYMPGYVPGHLIFVRGGSLYTIPFDLETLESTGEPTRVFGGVTTDSMWSAAAYDVALDGTLVYLPGDDWAHTRPTWIDHDGRLEPLDLPDQVYNQFRLSADRTKLAIQVVGAHDQVYVYDFKRRAFDRLTTLSGFNGFPMWKNDDESVVFGNIEPWDQPDVPRDEGPRPFLQPIDGSADAAPILTEEQWSLLSDPWALPLAVSPDSRWLLFNSSTEDTDIWVVPFDGSEAPRPLIKAEGIDTAPSFSPDGRWIAYMSNRTGPYELYVRPFPDVERREWRISSGGGAEPRWSPATNELFYGNGSDLYRVRYTTDPDFDPAEPELILTTDLHNSAGFAFDVSADGQRFLVNRPVGAGKPNAPLRVIQNWVAELP